MTDPRLAWERWCTDRLAGVTDVPGNLALVDYHPVGAEPSAPESLAGGTVWRQGDSAGVMIDPNGATVTVHGDPLTGPSFVPRLRSDGTPIIACGEYRIDVFSLDGSDYELRIYSTEAPNLDDFAGIDVYPYDPALVAPATFSAYAATENVAWEFTREADTGHTKKVPGTMTVTVDGTDHELIGFLDGDAWVCVFADGTTGAESYAPGRFLRIDRPADGAELTVDFNRAFIPPCGFSYYYSCPVPPAQNRLTVPIRAGEKEVRWKTPR